MHVTKKHGNIRKIDRNPLHNHTTIENPDLKVIKVSRVGNQGN